ncbi:MAG: AraC family transcriptional regulator [Pseudomonadota bacterium]|nr:AraC family transcriptional regulator [Pseudomonadota bacterium]
MALPATPPASTRYARRMQRVLAHIEQHLDEELSVEALSSLAHFSPCHFHRQFSAFTGMGVGRLVQLMRLRRASMQLVFNPATRITEIALEAGFGNPESFSRAFRKEVGQSPGEFRQNPQWAPWHTGSLLNKPEEPPDMQVTIIDFPQTLVAALEHRGPEHLTFETTRRFIEWRKENGLRPGRGNTYGVHYTDPETTPPEDYRLDLCLSIDAPVAPNRFGVVTKTIPAGRCALVRHLGSRHHVAPAAWLYRDWLPQSGEELRDFPIFFHYVNVGPDVKEQEMVTDVYLPLK